MVAYGSSQFELILHWVGIGISLGHMSCTQAYILDQLFNRSGQGPNMLKSTARPELFSKNGCLYIVNWLIFDLSPLATWLHPRSIIRHED